MNEMRKAPNAPDVDEKHLNVMDAVTCCIERYGLRKTRMEDIARHAGLSRISLYRDYGNRDKLINCFLSHRSRQFNDRIRLKVQACQSIEEALEYYLLTATTQAIKDVSIRELVEVHQVFQSALNDDHSPVKTHICELWDPLLRKLCPADAHILSLSQQEVADWILLMESNLILVAIAAGWEHDRLRSLIRNFLTPAFTLRSKSA